MSCLNLGCSDSFRGLTKSYKMKAMAYHKAENTRSFFVHFVHQWLYSPLLGPGLFFAFVIFLTQTVGLLGRVISPSQGHYLHTGRQQHRKIAHTDIQALCGIRTGDPRVRANEDSSCLKPRGRRDRPSAPSRIPYSLCFTSHSALRARTHATFYSRRKRVVSKSLRTKKTALQNL
jgi:hypothetical protein